MASAGPDGEVPGLAVTRPNLEDVYLSLIGDQAAGRSAALGDLTDDNTKEAAR
jgi:ABC-2 type transport system ATP-binding protein